MGQKMDFNNSFTSLRVDCDGVHIHLRHKGKGSPLLLIHGYPQTGYMWHKIADQLAASHHVIVPDLRGYGLSDKPATDASHSPYSKRAMAKDMMAVMAHFNYARFDVAGHDRGGRVAHRLARDYPDAVNRLAILDIAPTAAMYGAAAVIVLLLGARSSGGGGEEAFDQHGQQNDVGSEGGDDDH